MYTYERAPFRQLANIRKHIWALLDSDKQKHKREESYKMRKMLLINNITYNKSFYTYNQSYH